MRNITLWGFVYGVWHHFQQYFSYIVAVIFIGGGNRSTGENHLPATSHWQTLSHNVVLSTPHRGGIQTYNVSGDRHWLLWSRPRQSQLHYEKKNRCLIFIVNVILWKTNTGLIFTLCCEKMIILAKVLLSQAYVTFPDFSYPV